MEVFVDHYIVLGLPSGEEGIKTSEKEITKAYRSKALKLHPDKSHDNPDAVNDFQRLQSSYEILKDENSRRDFDADLLIRIRQQKVKENRRRKMSEREERSYRTTMARVEEIKIMNMMHEREEIDRVRMMSAMEESKRMRRRYIPDDKTRARLMNNLMRNWTSQFFCA
ncbi:putative DnaJ domain, Chaperone J-domain superfamily [Helianthus annuus]|uniref:DnaJ domain, Chaperone J-domain superfamily n=2 Tax=Helianthus annuus TaxID=4232 RepID=A0A251VF28_HELAN|nr:putative DnaJ domain, Chaperone J-domain superfamily [Helianthus annuus]KAJ0942758.1 putative DnaJ domain, Chaperone J-domain superfamily [Helianthus annuus]